MYKQICFVAQQTAHRLVTDYTKDEINQKALLRRIDTKLSFTKRKEALEDQLTREIYILEVTKMIMWPPEELHPLAKKLNIDPQDFPDTIHLAWMIVMMIVRDKVPYRFTSHRKLEILKKKVSKRPAKQVSSPETEETKE
jgi:hypothetical protein